MRIRADVAGVLRERPGALGDVVLAVLDQDELLVVVVVGGLVLDGEPPEVRVDVADGEGAVEGRGPVVAVAVGVAAVPGRGPVA